MGSALFSLVAFAGPLVPLAANAAPATAPAAPNRASASASPSTPVSAPVPGSPVPGSSCAIGDLVSIAVPKPSPLPTHEPGLPTIGGDLLAGNGLSVPIGSPALPAQLAATSWLVADLDSGAVLGACGAHRYGAPASVQKLLLLATALPKLKPTDVTTITAEDLNFEAGSSAVGLINGGTYTVEELFLGLILNSGNDAANTLARLAGGDRGVSGGLAEMNAEARRLGAWDTHAETPSGLDGPGQVTSVYDLALIFRACFGHEDFRRYLHTESARMPAQPPKDPNGFAIQNDNRLLFEYPGAFGGKTGFTDIARHTFVGAAERDGRRLVVAVLGAEIRPVRAWQQTAGLLDWGFALARDVTVGHLVAPGEAEKLMETPPSATAPVSAAPAAADPLPSQSPPAMVLVMVGAGAVAFGSAWVFAARLSRRRHAGHRQWRADAPHAGPRRRCRRGERGRRYGRRLVRLVPRLTTPSAHPINDPPPAATPPVAAPAPPEPPLMGQPPA